MMEHITNTTALAIAIFFNFHSSDFLLQYSLTPLAHQIHSQIHHLGDISTIDHIKITHEITIKIINIV
jgi:hypothetical protein